MLWVASLTTFFSFCCSGEVTVENEASYDHNIHLSFSDLTVNNAASPSVISNIKCSKTDQGREGCQIILGKTADDLSPIMALLDYLTSRGGKPGALFQWQDGTLVQDTICGGSQTSPNSCTPSSPGFHTSCISGWIPVN